MSTAKGNAPRRFELRGVGLLLFIIYNLNATWAWMRLGQHPALAKFAPGATWRVLFWLLSFSLYDLTNRLPDIAPFSRDMLRIGALSLLGFSIIGEYDGALDLFARACA